MTVAALSANQWESDLVELLGLPTVPARSWRRLADRRIRAILLALSALILAFIIPAHIGVERTPSFRPTDIDHFSSERVGGGQIDGAVTPVRPPKSPTIHFPDPAEAPSGMEPSSAPSRADREPSTTQAAKARVGVGPTSSSRHPVPAPQLLALSPARDGAPRKAGQGRAATDDPAVPAAIAEAVRSSPGSETFVTAREVARAALGGLDADARRAGASIAVGDHHVGTRAPSGTTAPLAAPSGSPATDAVSGSEPEMSHDAKVTRDDRTRKAEAIDAIRLLRRQ